MPTVELVMTHLELNSDKYMFTRPAELQTKKELNNSKTVITGPWGKTCFSYEMTVIAAVCASLLLESDNVLTTVFEVAFLLVGQNSSNSVHWHFLKYKNLTESQLK